MNTIQDWNPSFSVGHPLMDDQHRQLLKILRRAIEGMSSDTPDDVEQFHINLNDLADYVRSHFDTEEALLRRCNYPQLDAQQAEHQAYEARFTELLYQATMGQFDKASLCQQLTEWWVHHILHSDMQYRDYVQGRA